MNSPIGSKRGRDECHEMVTIDLGSNKRPKDGAEDSRSDNNSIVLHGASPSPVNSKSSKPEGLAPKKIVYPPHEKSIVNYLKDLCSTKEPIVKVGIEMVGAAYLLKLKRPICAEIESAMAKAVDAANALFHAEQLLSESQNTFANVLKFADDHN